MYDKYRLLPNRVEHMHYSLGDTRLGHTLVGRAGRYMDLVGCVLVLVAVSWGATWPASLSFRGPSPQALTLLGGARFIAWCLRHPFFRRMPTGPEAVLEPQGVSGLDPPKIGLVPHSSGWWGIQQIPTFSQPSNLTVQTDTSICCINTLILYIYIFCLFNTLIPPTFFSLMSSFWPLTGHNRNRNRNRKKNYCIDISSYKLVHFHTRRPEHGYKKEILREKLNLF